jgi:ubiquinone/menaquinone biosynthesis C-methylase UbiE
MDTKTNINNVKKFFDDMAETYINRFDDTIINSILDDCHIRVDSNILEAGSGTSDFTKYLLKRIGRNGKIICNDISDKMIRVAKNKIKDPRVCFVVGDLIEIDFKRFNIDRVICFNMYPHVSNKTRFIKNIYENLSSGGKFFICHDRNRESIIGMHYRHSVSNGLSEFPKIEEIVYVLKKSKFTINCIYDSTYFMISADKN